MQVTEGLAWRPVLETEYGAVPQEPLTALQTGSFHRVPVMSGTNQNDSAYFVLSESPSSTVTEKMNTFLFVCLLKLS